MISWKLKCIVIRTYNNLLAGHFHTFRFAEIFYAKLFTAHSKNLIPAKNPKSRLRVTKYARKLIHLRYSVLLILWHPLLFGMYFNGINLAGFQWDFSKGFC